MYKTFEELGYNVGDTVFCVKACNKSLYTEGRAYVLLRGYSQPVVHGVYNGYSGTWELVSRAGSTVESSETPQTSPPEPIYSTWGGMTPEEQGALLLAKHNGCTIEVFSCLGN